MVHISEPAGLPHSCLLMLNNSLYPVTHKYLPVFFIMTSHSILKANTYFFSLSLRFNLIIHHFLNVGQINIQVSFSSTSRHSIYPQHVNSNYGIFHLSINVCYKQDSRSKTLKVVTFKKNHNFLSPPPPPPRF